jgi:hypothetical protein
LPTDPDGTITSLAGTAEGGGGRVAIPDADGVTVPFNYYRNKGGIAELINSEPNKIYVYEASDNLTS